MRRILPSWLRWFNLHPLWRLPTTRVWGSRLRAPTADRWLALRLHRLRLMGVDDAEFLRTHVRPGMSVVDIGANQGLYSLLLARLTGAAGTVVAFEPDEMLCAALARNVALNGLGNIEPRQTALGSAAGTMVLFRSLLNSGDNRLSTKAGEMDLRESATIRVERLDEVLAGRRINFVKMDVQGWEMEVFRGMQGLLDDPQNAAMTIYFEFWPRGLRDAGSDPLAPLHFLNANRFRIYHPQRGVLGEARLGVGELLAGLEGDAYTNLCAVRTPSADP